MQVTKKPSLPLLFSIIGLPLFSETVYSPSLPDIARSLHTSASLAEHTLSIYLLAFTFGTLLWGKLSDKWGRRNSTILGIGCYLIGCIACFFSTSITALMVSRFIQAFGGSSGSVLGQAMCRDAFEGKELSKVYALLASALGVSPAIGPVVGGLIAQHYGWPYIFLFLIFAGLCMAMVTILFLPETLHHKERQSHSLFTVGAIMLTDPHVIRCIFLVGLVNGIMFSYFSEGSFYLITLLGLSPSRYGTTYMSIAGAIIFGGWLAGRAHQRFTSNTVIMYGIGLMLFSTSLLSLIMLSSHWIQYSTVLLASATVGTHMITMIGRCFVNSSGLSQALRDYRWCIGTASSVFGFFYYAIITLCSFGMGIFHNGSLLPMPLYFLSLVIIMGLVQLFLREKPPTTSTGT